MKVEPQQLKTFLIDAGIITDGQFEVCATQARGKGMRVEDVLIARKFIDAEQLSKLKAYVLGIPFVNLEKENIRAEVLELIPEPIARANNIVAFRRTGDFLEVAMLDPEDLGIIESIKKTTGLSILPRLTDPQGIKSAILRYQKTLMAEVGDLGVLPEDSGGAMRVSEVPAPAERNNSGELKKAAQDVPVIKIVDTLIKHAILERASDIHIEPTEKEVVVRYRVDGVLRDAMILPKSAAAGIVARIKVLSNLKLDECRLPQDGRFKVESDQWKYSLRVSSLPVFYGEKIVMRLLSESAKAYPLEKLGFYGEGLEKIKNALHKTMGMILMTGPTGSGKTTTLYSMIDILNEPGVNISTVEDPIEYQMPRVNQTQVNAKIGLTFASGLRTLLRQDPNIIMVGEIRDNETAALAINAALTGHLVLSTLHTNTAAGAIPRLIDMKAEPFLIASTLNVIIAQRLIRCLAAGKEEYRLKDADLEHLKNYCDTARILKILKEQKAVPAAATWKTISFWRPRPGKESADGYKERIGIHEALPVTSAVRELIVKNATADAIHEAAVKEGMVTMFEDGFVKAAQGFTSIEEVLRVISE
ncbi:MAG TPA: GspE/PulE family protein [Candidatus Pacearchaeota archaeon]|nr:GspE/PulE family protein [Candidatus Pacearchaeota archaeon]